MSQQQGPIIFNGRYELHSRLGRGGMAEVYLARDQMLDRPVAVKVLFPALATDPGFVERFRREAQSAAALNHPNIVGVYDWGEANGTYFIVMEYVEGESLADLIHAEGRLHPDRAAEIAADISAALGFAHRNGGVIHRDVKPGNVLITREGAVKVADFGIARAISDTSDANLTKTGSVMGTATYFSPEQARGAALDPRSDVYSVGCVLYEMIIGRPPFAGENAVAIAYKHVQEAPPSPRQIDPAVPDTLEAIILKCLAKNAANRYPSAQDLRADLRRYLDGARIMAEPVMAAPVDPGATSLMAPTGYMQPTAATGQPWDAYGDDGYGDAYGDEEEEEERSKAPLIVLIVLLVLLVGLLLWWALSSRDGGDAPEIEVINVVGQTEQAATEELSDEGFEVAVDPVSDEAELTAAGRSIDDTEEGTVFSQSPGPGEMAEEGSEVTIRVWAGSETEVIPQVRGKTEQEARDELRELGFTTTIQTEEDDEHLGDDIEEGEVTRTNPPEGEEIPTSQLVTIFVAGEPSTIPVPNVANQNLNDARDQIEGDGLCVNDETPEESSDSVLEGSVIRTDPAAGTEIPPDQCVTIVISQGARQTEVPVPPVTDLDQGAAEDLIRGANLTPDVTTTNNCSREGQVVRQNPPAGTPRPEGSTVNIVVAECDQQETTTTTSSTILPPPDLLRR